MAAKNPTALIKRPEVRKLTTLSDSAIYRLMDAGEFPRPVRLTPNGRSVAWREAEVLEWIESRVPQQGGAA